MSKIKNKKSSLGIIPARYASTRFEGKPLVDIGGKSMIQRVYEQAQQSNLDKVIVATDDRRIEQAVLNFGGQVVLTGEHETGTERCIEALQKQQDKFDIVVNIQGDEPFIQPSQINLLLDSFHLSGTTIATLVKQIDKIEEVLDPNLVKVVFNQQNQALYFSRNGIPFVRDKALAHWLEEQDYYKHIGLYAFDSKFLLHQYAKLAPSTLASSEKLEQLQWLDNGYNITIAQTNIETLGIDTPADLEKALLFLEQNDTK